MKLEVKYKLGLLFASFAFTEDAASNKHIHPTQFHLRALLGTVKKKRSWQMYEIANCNYE